MTILTPSTTPTTRQVWPPTADTPRGRWEQGAPVTLDEVQVGDTVTFWVEGRTLTDRPTVKVGKVVKITDSQGRRAVAWVATKRGRHVLTRKNWARSAPRR